MAEQNIFQEIEADLERQKYEELWKRYGALIIGVVIVIVLATAGISWWKSWHTEKNQEASVALFKIMEKSTDKPDATPEQLADLEKFAATHQSTAQHTIARLDAAGLAGQAGDLAKAAQMYDEIANDSSVEPTFRQFAILMSIRAQMDTGDPAQLQKRLEPLMTDDAPWHYTAMEYGGFLALRANEKEKARKIFAELSQDARVSASLSARAADMLHFLSE